MFCFRDMTFCTYHKECKDGKVCHRALTDKVKESAERWMKDAPISRFANKPKCFIELEEG